MKINKSKKLLIKKNKNLLNYLNKIYNINILYKNLILS